MNLSSLSFFHRLLLCFRIDEQVYEKDVYQEVIDIKSPSTRRRHDLQMRMHMSGVELETKSDT